MFGMICGVASGAEMRFANKRLRLDRIFLESFFVSNTDGYGLSETQADRCVVTDATLRHLRLDNTVLSR